MSGEYRAALDRLDAQSSSLAQATREATTRENTTRRATSEFTIQQSGVGQVRLREPLVFPHIYIQPPHITTGSAVLANPKPAAWNDPRGTCGIYAWTQDGRGYYTGALIWTRVDADLRADYTPADPSEADNPPAMKVKHYLSFSANAIKDIPTRGIPADMSITRSSQVLD